MSRLLLRCEQRIRNYSQMSRHVGMIRATVPVLARLNMFKSIYKLQIEVTTRCNLRCVMCEHTYWRQKPKSMSLENFKKAITSLPNLINVDITGIGETLLYEHFIEAIRFLREHNIFISFTTNLTLPIKPDIMNSIIDNAGMVKISIDASTKETYEQIRRGANWDITIKNLETLIEAKTKRNNGPKIQVVYTILEENFHEIIKAVYIFSSIGVDRICFQIPQLKDFQWHRDNRDLIYHAIESSKELYNSKKCEINFSKYELDKPVIHICSNAYNNAFITVDGDVFPCCFIHHGGNRSDYLKYSFGNIFELEKQIQQSNQRKQFIQEFENNSVPVLCRRCPVYSFTEEK